MHDTDVEKFLEKGVLVPDKVTTLSFAITTDKKFRITLKEQNGQFFKEMFIDMPKEDLATLSKEFPEFVKKMDEVNG